VAFTNESSELAEIEPLNIVPTVDRMRFVPELSATRLKVLADTKV
jgi:hypothetical protein